MKKDSPHKQTRIKDIAERAGVSVGTVDRVLHKRGEVSTETRDRVLQIAEELHYQPNVIARTLASKKKYHFGVLIPEASKQNLYWEAPLTGILKAQSELQAYGVRLSINTFSSTEKSDFQKKSQHLLDTETDGVILAPIYYSASKAFLNKCLVEELPVLFIDTKLDYKYTIRYIGQNSCQTGYVAARLLGMGQMTNSKFIVFNIAREKDQLFHFNEREKGFREYFLKEGNNNEITSYAIYDDSIPRIKNILQNYMSQHSKLNGIFVTGSKVYLLAQVLEEMGIGDIRLLGFDLVSQNLHYLKRNYIDFLISQQPEEQGYSGIQTLYSVLVQHQDVSLIKNMPIDIITKENLTQYLECK
ncbi:MAG: LacI family DNA-binding transcriptional regulator [Bacteroidales bacterium]|nr:LacI family DNA-binding transcriptional regulator [Bacteroidales bacterium]